MTLDAIAADRSATSPAAFTRHAGSDASDTHAWHATSPRSICERTLDLLPQPVWLVQSDMRVDHQNLAACSPPWSDAASIVQQRLNRLGDLDAKDLLAAIAQAQLAPQARSSQPLGLEVGGRLRRAELRTVPLMPAGAVCAERQFMLVLEMSGEPGDEAWLDHLCRHHRITPAERRVMQRLMRGDTPREMTGGLNVSYATVRTHLRSLYAKTGCRRQAELVQLGFGG
jgi:DNA-binding CsgD family transcriptional regulator